jgi:hypothetical protein
MATVRIEFETDNAAFEANGFQGELEQLLHSAVATITRINGCIVGPCDVKLRDSNGNTVGKVSVS